MSRKQFGLGTPDFVDWLEDTFHPEDPALARIRERAREAGLPDIHLGTFDALHLEVLARASGAQKIVEIGTLAGLSGVALARALPSNGHLYTFEAHSKHASLARETFQENDFESQVTLFEGPALERLPEIESLTPFDLVFVDADKLNYPNYAAWAAKYLRIGGLLIGDNTLAFGNIHKSDFTNKREADVIQGLQKFNDYCANSGHFRATILPTGEGLTLAVKIK